MAACEGLPVKARALLAILETGGTDLPQAVQKSENGLRHFLAQPDFPLTPEQFRASMASDYWEQ